jgi:hypothetical protein
MASKVSTAGFPARSVRVHAGTWREARQGRWSIPHRPARLVRHGRRTWAGREPKTSTCTVCRSRTGRTSQSGASTARLPATSEHPGWRSGISFRRLARSAERLFFSTERRSDPLLAAVRVELLSSITRKTAVYDLTVEGQPEFVAGGILIHNCAIAFAGRANAAPINVESHADGSITGDLMTKAW